MRNNLFSLEGKKALITGGSRGLGFAIARGLAESGADIAISSRHPDELLEAKKNIEDKCHGRRVFTFEWNLEKSDRMDVFFNKVLSEMGGVEILGRVFKIGSVSV